MPIKKESVGKPDYQPLQQHNNSDKSLKQIQRNQKRIMIVLAALGLLLLLVIVVGSTLVSISWSKVNVKCQSDFFQNCKQETTSCTLSRWLTFILPNCTTEGTIVHMKVNLILVTRFVLIVLHAGFYTLDVRCELSTDIKYLKVSTLVQDGTNSLRCQCSLLDVTPNGTIVHARGFHFPFTTVSCTLAITRCPI